LRRFCLILLLVIFVIILYGCNNSKVLRDGFSIADSSKQTSSDFVAYELDNREYELGEQIELKIFYGHNFYNDDGELSNALDIENALHKIEVYDTNLDFSVKERLFEYEISDFYELKYDIINDKSINFENFIIVTIRLESLKNQHGKLQISISTTYDINDIDGKSIYIDYLKDKKITFNK